MPFKTFATCFQIDKEFIFKLIHDVACKIIQRNHNIENIGNQILDLLSSHDYHINRV